MLRTIGTGVVTPPSGYSLVPNTEIQTPLGRITDFFEHVYNSGDTLQPQFTFSGTGGVEYICAGYSGVDPNVPVNASAGLSDGSSMSLSSPSVNATTNYGSLLMLYATDYSGTFSSPSSGFIDATDQNNGRGLAWVDAWPVATGATGEQSIGISMTTTGVGVQVILQAPSTSPTPTPTASPTPTATPTPDTLGLVLAQAIDTVRNDIEPSGVPLCAAPGTEPCSTLGSVSTSNLAGNNSTDDTSALQTDLNAGDVDLGAHTYLIHGTVTLSTRHTLHCEPGAILHSDTSGTILSLSSVTMATVMGCAFHNGKITVSGGSDNAFIGNTFDVTAPFTLTGSTSDNIVAFNDFQGGAPSTGGDTHVMYWANRVSGAPVLQMPINATTGGQSLQNDMAKLLNFISYGSTSPSSGNNNGSYQVVQPGSGGCHGNGTGDDTSCIYNALANGNIFVHKGTYNMTGDNAVPSGRSILCQPGTVFYYNEGGNTGQRNMFGYGWALANTGNDSVFSCVLQGSWSGQSGYGNYYNELIRISDQGHIVNMMVAGSQIYNALGDNVNTYSGVNGTQTYPRDIAFLFDHIGPGGAQPGYHANGGAHLENLLDLVDSESMYPESDDYGGPFQNAGMLVRLSRAWNSGSISCDGNSTQPENHSAAWCWNNVADGSGAQIQWERPGCAVSGYVVGNYTQNMGINGGVVQPIC